MDLTNHPKATGFEFPTDTVLIALGPATAVFRTDVESHLLDAGAVRTDAPITVRESGGGRYIAVHVPVHVGSREELERLYAVVQAVPGLRYRL